MNATVHHWTMLIDIDKCTGCSACVVACHAENNVPIHPEKEVARGHGMHWVHLERYWDGAYPNVKAYFFPLMCQQCNRAPCEPVCPVYATNHSNFENLNLQVYNRCVGTRYCQNNDPYKVRFFNFFDPPIEESLSNQLNPDVTVRSAGVMEKCTFCVQRIRRAEEEARARGVDLKEGDVIPACVQTCPPSSLIFGDRSDPESAVSKLMEQEKQRSFRLLESLGTEPSVIYLKGRNSSV
jgi:molybdopterin-containing oxidoreductase family iron-sulfur binding subunit